MKPVQVFFSHGIRNVYFICDWDQYNCAGFRVHLITVIFFFDQWHVYETCTFSPAVLLLFHRLVYIYIYVYIFIDLVEVIEKGTWINIDYLFSTALECDARNFPGEFGHYHTYMLMLWLLSLWLCTLLRFLSIFLECEFWQPTMFQCLGYQMQIIENLNSQKKEGKFVEPSWHFEVILLCTCTVCFIRN